MSIRTIQSTMIGLAAMAVSSSGVYAQSTPQAAPRASNVPNLINVDLRNVLNDLSVRLNLDRANVPINIQLPVTVAANVCGVSVNVLAASAASGRGSCTAVNGSPQLAQVVQQQMAAGGSVGGGAQGGSTAATSGTATAAPASGGATGTSAASVGAGAAPGNLAPATQPSPAAASPVGQATTSALPAQPAAAVGSTPAPRRRTRRHRVRLPRI